MDQEWRLLEELEAQWRQQRWEECEAQLQRWGRALVPAATAVLLAGAGWLLLKRIAGCLPASAAGWSAWLGRTRN